MIPSMFRTPAALSILAIRWLSGGSSVRTAVTSSAWLANDRAKWRMPHAAPTSIAARSLSVRVGSTGAGSTITARLELTRPPSTTTDSALSSPTSAMRSTTPSKSTCRVLPGRRVAKVARGLSCSRSVPPGSSSATRRTRWPGSRVAVPPATRPQRTCAPSVSRQIGTEQSSRTRLIVGSTASSGVWDRLRRNRSTPRSASPPITSSLSDAGPNVQSTCSFTSRFPPVVDGCASPMGQTAAIGRTRCRWFYATRACRSARICMSLPTADARLPGACGVATIGGSPDTWRLDLAVLRHRNRPLWLDGGGRAPRPPSRRRFCLQRRRQAGQARPVRPLEQCPVPQGGAAGGASGALPRPAPAARAGPSPGRSLRGLGGAGAAGLADHLHHLPGPGRRRPDTVAGRPAAAVLRAADGRPGPVLVLPPLHRLAPERAAAGGVPGRPLHPRGPRRPGGGQLLAADGLVERVPGPVEVVSGAAPGAVCARIRGLRRLVRPARWDWLEALDRLVRAGAGGGPRQAVAGRPDRGPVGRSTRPARRPARLRRAGVVAGVRGGVLPPPLRQRPRPGVPARPGPRQPAPARRQPSRAPGDLGLPGRPGLAAPPAPQRVDRDGGEPGRAALGPLKEPADLIVRRGRAIPAGENGDGMAIPGPGGRGHGGVVVVGRRAVRIGEHVDRDREPLLEPAAGQLELGCLLGRRLLGEDGVVQGVRADGEPPGGQRLGLVPVQEQGVAVGGADRLAVGDELGDGGLRGGPVPSLDQLGHRGRGGGAPGRVAQVDGPALEVDLAPAGPLARPAEELPPGWGGPREQARDQEEGCRQAEAFEQGGRHVEAVAVAVVEAERDRPRRQGLPLGEVLQGRFQGDHVGDPAQDGELAGEPAYS